MGKRRRTEIEKIEDRKKLNVTFTKRRQGLFKKAKELSILCNSQIALLVFSSSGKPYVYGDLQNLTNRRSWDIEEMLDRTNTVAGLLQGLLVSQTLVSTAVLDEVLVHDFMDSIGLQEYTSPLVAEKPKPLDRRGLECCSNEKFVCFLYYSCSTPSRGLLGVRNRSR
ncbi:hypothetical protein AQUCO_01800120v1 [Aquilegia coerulea]|uniref:MADS-box domain-containing protein n=1 Tax=Aquilegia coerulea TaxID=218851 RepID=A0A2G5DK20_AQUCA|nr:hypothetical protein AQUCO_01800120v1 [Aquilegia coerulea]